MWLSIIFPVGPQVKAVEIINIVVGTTKMARIYVFMQDVSVLLLIFWRQQIGWSYLLCRQSDAIGMKWSVC